MQKVCSAHYFCTLQFGIAKKKYVLRVTSVRYVLDLHRLSVRRVGAAGYKFENTRGVKAKFCMLQI